MKKLVILFLIFGNFGVFAQTRPATQYGFKVGASISRVKIIDNPSNIIPKFKNNLNAGVFYRWNFDKFSIQPELYFDAKGGTLKDLSKNFTETNNTVLRNDYQYISVPIIFGYEVAKNIHIVVGTEYNTAINKGKLAGPGTSSDYAAIGGVRIDMLDAAHLFNLNIRYVHGLSNITNRTYTVDKIAVPLDFRNRTLQISATFNFSDYYRWYKKYGDKKKKK